MEASRPSPVTYVVDEQDFSLELGRDGICTPLASLFLLSSPATERIESRLCKIPHSGDDVVALQAIRFAAWEANLKSLPRA